MFVVGEAAHEQDMMSPALLVWFDASTAALLIAAIAFPREWYIHAALCWLWGLTGVINGGDFVSGKLVSAGFLVPVALYLLGCLFAVKRGALKTHAKVKVVLSALALAAAFASQVRYSPALLLSHGVDLLAFSLIAGVAALVSSPVIQHFRLKPKDAIPLEPVAEVPVTDCVAVVPLVLSLNTSQYSVRDVEILQKVLEGAKYLSIAGDCKIGVTTLKNRVHILYVQIGVGSRTDFMARYARYTLIRDDEEAVSPEAVPKE
jgi:DNA-binding CsgD family transcriptional regulator